MQVRWTDRGFRDAQSIYDFIAEANPRKASDVMGDIVEALDVLSRSPHIGRRGRIEGTRELVVPPYVIGYRIRHEAVEILVVQHGSKRCLTPWTEPPSATIEA